MTIIQVSGPPCSGKSTWITNNTQPGDTILDDNNELADVAGGRDKITPQQWKAWHRRLNHAIATHTGPGRLIYVQGNPKPRAPGVTVIRLPANYLLCHKRAHDDNRPTITHTWITQWFTKYGWVTAEMRQAATRYNTLNP